MAPHDDPSHDPERPAGSSSGAALAEVTNAIVRLHRIHYGKGPTRSKSYVVDDVLICVLRDVLTPGEKTLAEAGQDEQIRAHRLAFRDVMHEVFADAIEEILGRPVLGFTSQILVERELVIEVFVLGPEGG
jgi:uncharacterized protein YbcI